MGRQPFNSLMGADPSDDSLHLFETSWVVSPFVLFCIRAIISLFVFVSHFFIFGWNGTHGDDADSRQSFSFFTHLTFWGVGFYFLFAALHTFLYHRKGKSVLFDKWPRFLRALHSVFYSTIAVFPIIVTIIFWGMLYNGGWFDDEFVAWRNVATHILPTIFAFFEIVFTTTKPLPLLHLPCLILILLLYLCVAYITRAAQGFYTYAFLDPGVDGENNGRVAGYCFAILGATIGLFLVIWGLIWARRWLVGTNRTKWAKSQQYWDSRRDVEVALQERK